MPGANQILTAGPSPLSVAVAKANIRVLHSLDDSVIQSMINAGTERVEQRTGRSLRPSTALLILDGFPDGDDHGDGEIAIPRPPFTALTSVQYLDTSDALQTLANCRPFFQFSPGEIHRPAVSYIWPLTRTDRANAVQVTYSCGYAAGQCPASLIAAIVLHVELSYHEQTAVDSGTLNDRIDALCAPFVIRDKRLIEISDQQ